MSEAMHLSRMGSRDLEEIIGNFESVANGPCNGQGGWLKVLR